MLCRGALFCTFIVNRFGCFLALLSLVSCSDWLLLAGKQPYSTCHCVSTLLNLSLCFGHFLIFVLTIHLATGGLLLLCSALFSFASTLLFVCDSHVRACIHRHSCGSLNQTTKSTESHQLQNARYTGPILSIAEPLDQTSLYLKIGTVAYNVHFCQMKEPAIIWVYVLGCGDCSGFPSGLRVCYISLRYIIVLHYWKPMDGCFHCWRNYQEVTIQPQVCGKFQGLLLSHHA